MSVEFTHVPTTSRRHLPQYLSPQHLSRQNPRSRCQAFEAAFGNIVIDGPGGILTNMDVAAEIVGATSAVGIALTHWSGVIHPVVAAQQIAVLDRLAEGRLSLRFLLGPDGQDREEAGSHVDTLRQTDEYLVLLKRLWSNELPFDHEGPHYSLAGGFVAKKGPQGPDMPIRMGGVSGVALDVAGRHATVFELTPGAPEEIRDLIGRVEAAASRYGRAGRIRFALPVRLAAPWRPGEHDPSDPVAVWGPPARVAQTLLAYAALGICEFMVSGLDDEESILAFARDVAPLFQRAVPIQAARRTAGFPRPSRRSLWAS